MGTYKKGILGPFRGRVGTVVGSIWQGIHYLKSLPDTSDTDPTPAQLNVRAKMALVSTFLKRLKKFINVGFQQFNDGITPMNAATSYLLKNGITGTNASNYAIDYSKVLLSAGDLVNAESATVAITVANQLDFAWLNEAPVGTTGGTDMATVVVYNPTQDKFVSLQNAALRSALGYDLSLPGFSGQDVHCWIYFVSADGKEVSDSYYIGEFLVL